MEDNKNLINEDRISIDDFAKIKLVVAKVLECEPVEKSRKLLKLKLYDGISERIVLSGISKYYLPSELIGHNIILVSNLKPAKFCGVESDGMILAAKHGENLKVIMVDEMPAGSTIS